jgi:hypothetical protein
MEGYDRFIGALLRGLSRLQPGRKLSSCGAGQAKPVRRQGGPAFTPDYRQFFTN